MLGRFPSKGCKDIDVAEFVFNNDMEKYGDLVKAKVEELMGKSDEEIWMSEGIFQSYKEYLAIS